ncbi:hypothetical protein IE53DRAFT_389150 [Violaceomyces palustris]|uniref:Uncharacterized protein n=1 Tax=Violaceomyces palustris TaxID=1673888 RepID=A0ACD0NS75_9BASI|nr:hypothetical protein IE53DRAFT_389150 [Violaceomyces palustris]
MEQPQLLPNGTVVYRGEPLLSFNLPFAYLDDNTATAFFCSQLIYTATLGFYFWDVVTTLAEDYQIVFKKRFRVATLSYLCSRWGTFGFVFFSWIFQCVSIGHCAELQIAAETMIFFGASGTAALFYARVTALHHGDKKLRAFFQVLLCFVVASALAIPVGRASRPKEIFPTKFCSIEGVERWGDLLYIATVINDTAVFVATTALLIRMAARLQGATRQCVSNVQSHPDLEKCVTGLSDHGSENKTTTVADSDLVYDGQERPRRLSSSCSSSCSTSTWFRLPAMTSVVTREILRGGVQYYFVATISNVIALAILLSNLSPNFKGMWTIPSMAMNAAMTGRVFRSLALLLTKDQDIWERQALRRKRKSLLRRFGPGTFTLSGLGGAGRIKKWFSPGAATRGSTTGRTDEKVGGRTTASIGTSSPPMVRWNASTVEKETRLEEEMAVFEVSRKPIPAMVETETRILEPRSVARSDTSAGPPSCCSTTSTTSSGIPPNLRRLPPAIVSNQASGLILYDLGNTLDLLPPRSSPNSRSKEAMVVGAASGSRKSKRWSDVPAEVVILRSKRFDPRDWDTDDQQGGVAAIRSRSESSPPPPTLPPSAANLE